MQKVIADIEIEDQKIEHYSAVIISQKFNEHHTFSIRVKYDVLETVGSFSLSNSQKLIGKSAVIKLLHANTLDIAYEFHGLVCEIVVEQSDNFTSDLVIKGYSPTILLENGQNFNSFYKKKLTDIVGKLTQSLSQINCSVANSPQFKNPVTYISQYRESAFHFINRLSAQFGEWFYYDGQQLFFGKPSSPPNIEVTYGVDVHSMQVKLKILPLTFSGYSYSSKDDKFITADAPANLDGLGQYASFVLNESNKIFSDAVSFPVKQRVESKSDLEGFLKQQKTAMAADLEVVSATSDNPAVCIGAVADIKVSVISGNDFKKEDGGKYVITSVSHYISDNGKYHNNFEGIPSAIDVIPVDNVIVPLAEPQIATVKDNKDPDNMGRVRVQMLWQQGINEQTDWLRVMTPDAGGGKDGAKNRGLVVVPEVGDQVLICFRYNDPDRPLVMGGMFHGKTGGGGGQGNNTKSLTSKSGHTITLDDSAGIIIKDKSTKDIIELDGTNKISITADTIIELTVGSSSITMNKNGTIEIKGKKLTINGDQVAINGTEKVIASSGPVDAPTSGTIIDPDNISTIAKTKLEMGAGSEVLMGSNGKASIGAKNELSMGSDGTVNIVGKGETSIQGEKVNLN